MNKPVSIALTTLLLCLAPSAARIHAAPAAAPGEAYYTEERVFQSRPDPTRERFFGGIGTTGLKPRIYPGVVFGLLCASVVWAMVVPGNKMQIQQLLSRGFEDAGLRLERGFPDAAGVWNGDRAQVVRSESAAEGQHVVRFGPAGKRRFSYVNGMVDVTGLGRDGKSERPELRLTVKVRAVKGNRLAQRYTLRLAAFAEDAAAVKEQWFSGGEASERALGFASRVLEVNQDGWATLDASLPLPVGARHVVVSIGAATVDSTAPKVEHELDALRLELITTTEVLP